MLYMLKMSLSYPKTGWLGIEYFILKIIFSNIIAHLMK